jgi:monothiol glutaredoxin
MNEDIRKKIEDMITQNEIVLFMKGTRHFPQCGFSARAIEALKRTGAEFQTVNILEDQEMRQGIKEFSQWPTIPQVYIRGKFIGGSDILLQLFESGELHQIVQGTPS